MDKFIFRKDGILLEVMTQVLAKESDPSLRIKKKWDMPNPRGGQTSRRPPLLQRLLPRHSRRRSSHLKKQKGVVTLASREVMIIEEPKRARLGVQNKNQKQGSSVQ